MKVFVLTHYLDNGEEYPEDRMEWEEHYYFSSEEILCASYSLDDYESKEMGSWKAEAIELNTQETEVLWKTDWKSCRPLNNYDDEFDPTPDPYVDEDYYDEDSDDYADYLEEWSDANEWLVHNKSNLKDYLALYEEQLADEPFSPLEFVTRDLQNALDMIHEDYPREL